MDATITAASSTSRGRLPWRVAMLLLTLALLVPGSASAGEGYPIQVFALSGPVCPVAIEGRECPDVLLPGVELVLQRYRKNGWSEVQRFETNISGYAHLRVERRGRYRIDVARDDAPGIRPHPLPFFLGPVTFGVPARHVDASGRRTTPVVVHFDSGIR